MYRNRAVNVIFLLLVGLTLLSGQRRQRPHGPRATALAVMSPDGKTVQRLIPICIRANGQFWDASIYQASPRPMALDFGVVYEVERTGKPIGLFTITEVAQERGGWIARGDWQPPRPHAPPTSIDSDDERPVLRRAEPSSAAPSPAPPPPPPSDAQRPILTRNPSSSGSEPASEPSASHPAPKAKPPQLVPAISDADGPDPRPFTLERNADQELHFRKAAAALVEQAVLKHAGLTPGAARLDFSEASMEYFDLDGNNSGEIVLTARVSLLPEAPRRTARRRPSSRPPSSPPSIALREFYVTLIGREDLYGDLRPSFTRIVDARNLDLDGRLELIDAVDADGDGRGELLFRRLIGRDVTYVVLKVGLSQTTKLFDSAGD